MNMSGHNYKNPAIMLTKAYGDMILAASQQGRDGLWRQMVIANCVQTVQTPPAATFPAAFLLRSFGNLDLKPEITAPGGNIPVHPEQWDYGNMSGTLHVRPQR